MLGLGLGIFTFFPIKDAGPIATYQAEIVQPEIKRTLGPEDFNIVLVKNGDSLGKIAKRSFPDLDARIGIQIILEFNNITKNCPLRKGMEIKIPKVESLREIGYEEKIGVGLSSEGCISRPSNSLRNFIMSLEGEELSIYNAGVANSDLTIGYGHSLTQQEISTLNNLGYVEIHGVVVTRDNSISKPEARKIFNKDFENAIRVVNRANLRNINQGQYDALVSLVFNLGSIPKSVRKSILAGRLNEVPNIIRRYNKSGGRTLKGLIDRREEEIALWLSGRE